MVGCDQRENGLISGEIIDECSKSRASLGRNAPGFIVWLPTNMPPGEPMAPRRALSSAS